VVGSPWVDAKALATVGPAVLSLAALGAIAALRVDRFAGAILLVDNPYGARFFLRDLDGEGASELRYRTVPLRGGGSAEKGEAVDAASFGLAPLSCSRTARRSARCASSSRTTMAT